MANRITVDQLEQMKTHELADLLSNVVLLLRRMPDVECRQLIAQLPEEYPTHDIQRPQPGISKQPDLPDLSDLPDASDQPLKPLTLTREQLKNKKVDELKQLAKEARLRIPAKIKKDELINKLLAMGHTSEQFAIQDI